MTYVHKLSCWEIKLHEQKCKLKLKLKSNQRNNKKKKTKNLKKALRYLDHLDSSFFPDKSRYYSLNYFRRRIDLSKCCSSNLQQRWKNNKEKCILFFLCRRNNESSMESFGSLYVDLKSLWLLLIMLLQIVIAIYFSKMLQQFGLNE